MRNALFVLLALASSSLVACSDASGPTTLERRTKSTIAGGVDDGQPSEGENATDPGNPNAKTPPPPPTTPGQATGEMAVTVSSATAAADLGGQIELTVTVEPKSGFKGEAALTATGLPNGATATFTPATVTLNTAAATSKLLVDVPVTAVASPPGGSSPVVISATVGTITATANASVKVNPAVKLTIPMNIDALRSTGTKYLDQWGPAFGANPSPLRTQVGNGIVVTVFNADSQAHIVHGNNGFSHGSTQAGQEVQPNSFELVNGAPRTRTLSVGANVNGYPHDGSSGASAGFRIQVQAAP